MFRSFEPREDGYGLRNEEQMIVRVHAHDSGCLAVVWFGIPKADGRQRQLLAPQRRRTVAVLIMADVGEAGWVHGMIVSCVYQQS